MRITRSMTRQLGSGNPDRMKALGMHPNKNDLQTYLERAETEKEKSMKSYMKSIEVTNKIYEKMREKNHLTPREKKKKEKCCDCETCSISLSTKHKTDQLSRIVRDNQAFGVILGNTRLTDMTEGVDNTLAKLKKVQNEIKEKVIVMQSSSSKNDIQCKNGPLTSLNGPVDSSQQKHQKETKTCEVVDLACATNLSSLLETDGKENTKNMDS